MLQLCPWAGFAPSTSHFCEAALCGVIREPANTWSNVGFVVAGVYIWRSSRDVPRLVRLFGLVCIAVGVGSAAFHATGTWLGGVMDNAAMQATAAFMLAANVLRLLSTDADRRATRLFWAMALVGTLTVIAFESIGRTLFALEVTLAGVVEIVVVWRKGVQRAHRYLALSWVTFMAAYAFWWRDLHGNGCDPSNHVLNGHAAWHLLMALCLFFLQRFHAHFVDRTGVSLRSPSRSPKPQGPYVDREQRRDDPPEIRPEI